MQGLLGRACSSLSVGHYQCEQADTRNSMEWTCYRTKGWSGGTNRAKALIPMAIASCAPCGRDSPEFSTTDHTVEH